MELKIPERAILIDYFFLLRPTLWLPVWIFLFLGYFWGAGLPLFSFTFTLPSYFWRIFTSYSLLLGAVYIINQIFDIDSDRINKKLFLLSEGIIPVNSAWLYTFTIIFISLILALPLGMSYISLWIVSLFMGLLYSVPPFRFKGRAWLDVLSNSIGYGFINFLVGYISSENALDINAIIHSIPYVLAVSAVFLNTTVPDITGDRASDLRTTGVLLGKRRTTLLALISLVLSLFSSLLVRDFLAFSANVIALPPFVLAFMMKEGLFTKVSYRIGGGAFFLITSVRFPVFLSLGILTYILLMFYYKRRFGIDYPSLKGR